MYLAFWTMCLFRWKDLHFQLKFPTPSRYGSNALFLYGQQSNAHWFLGGAEGGESCWNLIDQCIKIQIFSPNGECRAVTFSYYLYVFPLQIPVTSACHLRFLIKSGFDHFVSIHNVSVDGTAVHWTSVFTFRQVVNRSKYMYMNEASNYSYLLAEGCWLLATVLYGCNLKPCGFCHCPLGILGLTLSIKCRSSLEPPPPPPHDRNKSFFLFCLLSLRTFSILYFPHV